MKLKIQLSTTDLFHSFGVIKFFIPSLCLEIFESPWNKYFMDETFLWNVCILVLKQQKENRNGVVVVYGGYNIKSTEWIRKVEK